jgi:hypothetical protein
MNPAGVVPQFASRRAQAWLNSYSRQPGGRDAIALLCQAWPVSTRQAYKFRRTSGYAANEDSNIAYMAAQFRRYDM